jgi:hypothetical protein
VKLNDPRSAMRSSDGPADWRAAATTAPPLCPTWPPLLPGKPGKAGAGQSPDGGTAVGAEAERRRPRALRRQICSSLAACSSSPLSALNLGRRRRVQQQQRRSLGPSAHSHGGELLLLPRDRPGAPPPPHGAAARHALPPHGLGAARNSRRSADLTACPHSAGRHARLGRRRPAHLNE